MNRLLLALQPHCNLNDYNYQEKCFFIIIMSAAYLIPTNNRVKINIIIDIDNADKMAQRKAPSKAVRNTLRRPHVSAKNPQKCELTTMPM